MDPSISQGAPIHIETSAAGAPPETADVRPIDRDSTNSPPVRLTPPPNPVPTKQQIKNIRAEKKMLQKEISKAKTEAFGKNTGLDVMQRMAASQKFKHLEQQLQVTDRALNNLQQARTNPIVKKLLNLKRRAIDVKNCIAQIKPSKGLVSSRADKAILATDIAGAIFSGTKAHQGALDVKASTELINAATERLKDPNLRPEDKEKLQQGIHELKKHREACTAAQDAPGTAQAASLTAYLTAHGTVAAAHLATVVSVGTSAGSVVGSVGSVVLAPIAAALSFDAVVAIKRNLNQVKRDRRTLETNYERNATVAKEQMQDLGDVIDMLQAKGADSQLTQSMVSLQVELYSARSNIDSYDNKLMQGNLSKKEVAELKNMKATMQIRVDNSLKIAANLLGGREGLEDVHKLAQSKQILSAGFQTQTQVLNRYLMPKLRNKEINEYVRTSGQVMGLVGTGLGVAGAVTTLAHGVGLPLFAAGAVCSLSGLVTTYAAAPIINQLRLKQQGKDRVHGQEFREALVKQLKVEMEHWDNIPKDMQQQSTTSTMFEMLRKHYPNMPKNAREWATALADDPPNGPQHKQLKDAMELMVSHDSTKGVIGTLAKHVTKGLISKFTKEKT